MNETTLLGQLEQALCEEAVLYRRLLRRVHRAQSYMVRRRARQLIAISQEIAQLVPTARRASSLRASLVEALARRLGQPAQTSLKSLLAVADTPTRERLAPRMAELAAAAEELYKRNFQNHQLASYSSQLVGEELRILCGEAPDDGQYGDKGRAEGTPSRLVNGRA